MTPAEPAQPSPSGGRTAYRRVLLKLSGEVFGGGEVGLDPVVVHAVGHVVYPAEMLAAWPDEGRQTRMVFIARGWTDAFFAQVRDAARALVTG